MNENEYWKVKYAEACLDCEAADVRYVMSYGAKVTQDGDEWCCLIGNNLQEGVSTFAPTAHKAVELMDRKLRGMK